METVARQVVKLIHSHRLRRATEKLLQADIEGVFKDAGLSFERERRLTAEERIDFLVDGGVGVEVKIKGSKPQIYAQCLRYCELPEVQCLVLVTGVAMTLPAEIAGKPAYVASLGRAFL